jgi:hypothetical protein
MRGLHWPDAMLQPINQRQVIGPTSEQRLAKMYMRLHKSGQDSTTARVNDRFSIGHRRTHTYNESVANQEIAVNDRVTLIHRHERAVFYEY